MPLFNGTMGKSRGKKAVLMNFPILPFLSKEAAYLLCLVVKLPYMTLHGPTHKQWFNKIKGAKEAVKMVLIWAFPPETWRQNQISH